MISEKKRIDWIDNAKGIGILFVMLGHCYLKYEYVFWFASFHMTLFFFCSGVTYKRKGSYYHFFIHKIKTIIVPYCFFASILVLYSWVMSIRHQYDYDIVEDILNQCQQKRYNYLWFLVCLFVAMQLMYFTEMVAKERWFYAHLTWMSVFIMYRIIINRDLIWNVDLAFGAVSIMCLGKEYFSKRNRTISIIKIITLGGISIICSTVNCLYYGMFDLFKSEFANPFFSIVAALTGTFCIIQISKKINNRFVCYLGKNSLLFYGLHRIIIDLTIAVYHKIGFDIGANGITQICFAILSVVVTIIVLIPCNWWVKKYIPWALGKCKNNKK